MHADNTDFEDTDPSRTHPDLKRAREILLRRTTRAAKFKARKEALGLYMRVLPTEVLAQIFDCFVYMVPENPHVTFEASNSLAACSLACRRWSRLAQNSLHKRGVIPNDARLSLFHRTLTSSDQFGGSVRDFLVHVEEPDPDEDELPIPVDQMIAECLERTPNLKTLYLDIQPRAALTNAVLQCLQFLPQLKSFHLDQGNFDWPGGPVHNSGFDPMLLRFLPSSVENFSLVAPFLDVMRTLPDVFQRVYPSQTVGQAAGPPPDTPAQSNDSLKLLSIVTNVSGTSNAIDFPVLINTTSIPATLSTLFLRLSSQVDNNEQELWNNFIGSCKRLRELDIGITLATPSIFTSMPPVRQLQVLNILVMCLPTQIEWEALSESIVGYVAQTTRLTDFALKARLEDYTEDSIERFIQHLIPAFSIGNRCRLRSFSFGCFNSPLTLNTIEHEGPERILFYSRFVAPSIYTFELLCMRATQLEHLDMAVPLDFLSRVTRALETLKRLKTINLHNYPLIIDPATPLSKMKQYKHFLFCCRLLIQHLRVAEP